MRVDLPNPDSPVNTAEVARINACTRTQIITTMEKSVRKCSYAHSVNCLTATELIMNIN